jgi:thymidylate synthase
MISVEADSADEAWRIMIGRFKDSAKYQASRDQPTKELTHVAMTIKDPRQRVVFSRPINPAFAIAEVIWILAGADDVQFLSFWNPRMRNYSDDGICLRGAYGYRLGSQPRLGGELTRQLRHWNDSDGSSTPDQLRLAYEAFRKTPDTRQVVVQMWDARVDMPNPFARSKDVPCNLIGHPMIRDGKLEWLEVMRSNDFVWGLPYNIIQFTTIQEIMAGWLGIGLGSYVHISDSLHAYQRHWPDLEYAVDIVNPIPKNEASLGIRSYEAWEAQFVNVVKVAYDLTRDESVEGICSLYRNAQHFPSGYREWVALLAAEALRRREFLEESHHMAKNAGAFWQATWKRWAETARRRQLATKQIVQHERSLPQK